MVASLLDKFYLLGPPLADVLYLRMYLQLLYLCLCILQLLGHGGGRVLSLSLGPVS